MGKDPSVSSALGLKMIDALRKIVNHPRFFSPEVPGEGGGEGGKEGGTLSEAAIIKVLRTTKASMAAEEVELELNGGGGKKKKKMNAKEKAAAAAAAAAEAAVELPSCMSGKLAVLEELLEAIYTQTPDRVVVCSSYTNTLDMLQQMCERQRWEFLRLDGSVSISQRQVFVCVSSFLPSLPPSLPPLFPTHSPTLFPPPSLPPSQGLVEAFNRGAGGATRKKGEPFVFLCKHRGREGGREGGRDRMVRVYA